MCARICQTNTKHNVEHHIVTSGPPLHARARRLDADKLSVAKAELAQMESMGILHHSNSPWASPLCIVPKGKGGWRPCGDFRRLNTVTEDDIPKMAVITLFGLWEFIRMPFGLKNAAQAFQRLMDGVLLGIPFAFVYLDDILIASRPGAEHNDHLHTVLGLLWDNGLFVNRSKCILGVRELDSLAHRVCAARVNFGINPLPSKVDTITGLPSPTSKHELQSFLGMVNYYHRFMPKIAAYSLPYTRQPRAKART